MWCWCLLPVPHTVVEEVKKVWQIQDNAAQLNKWKLQNKFHVKIADQSSLETRQNIFFFFKDLFALNTASR